MILSAAIIAALGWWIELSIAHRYPTIRRLASSFLLANAGFSLAIAFCLSFLFGAEGTTVLLAALGTATLSALSYRAWAAGERAAESLKLARAKLAGPAPLAPSRLAALPPARRKALPHPR